MKAVLTRWLDRGRVTALGFGPYAAAALLLPGGSVVVGIVWLYRRRKAMEIQS